MRTDDDSLSAFVYSKATSSDPLEFILAWMLILMIVFGSLVFIVSIMNIIGAVFGR